MKTPHTRSSNIVIEKMFYGIEEGTRKILKM